MELPARSTRSARGSGTPFAEQTSPIARVSPHKRTAFQSSVPGSQAFRTARGSQNASRSLTSIAVQNNQAAAGIESALRTPTDDRTWVSGLSFHYSRPQLRE